MANYSTVAVAPSPMGKVSRIAYGAPGVGVLTANGSLRRTVYGTTVPQAGAVVPTAGQLWPRRGA